MIIGIDPGLHGALALMTREHELVQVWDMPCQPKAKGKGNEVNAYLLADIVSEIMNLVAERHEKAEAIIEQVGPMPRDSRPAAFKFGDSFGVLRGALGAHYVPMRFATPHHWKHYHGLTKKEKGASRMAAIGKWPDKRNLFERVKDDGRAEACLIAEFGLTIAGWG